MLVRNLNQYRWPVQRIWGLMMFGRILAPAAVFLIVLPCSAETLDFASPAAPNHPLHTEVIEPWIEQIVSNSAGTLEIRTFYSSPLGNYSNIYDRVLDDVVDIAFTTLSAVGGQFKKTDVAALPFETQSAVEGSVALWNLYERGIISDEFEDIKLLGLFMFPNSALHMSDHAIHRLEDFKGIKIRTAGKIQSETIALLGGSPVTAEPSEIYLGIERGVFDGAVMPWTGVPPFKLEEVTYFHLDAPLGSAVAMIFMNQKVFDSLPAAAQRAIDNSSGQSLSMWLSGHTDYDANRARDDIGGQPGHFVWEIEADERKRWEALSQTLVEDWVRNTPGGAEVLEAFRHEVNQQRED